jgi:hypothetical protein
MLFFRYDFLLSLFYVFSIVICVFFMFLCCLCFVLTVLWPHISSKELN